VTRLIVEAQGQVESQVVDVGDDDCVLLGRAPDASRLTDPTGPLSGQVRPFVVAAPSVSSNHAAAWSAGGEMHLVDLDSRNGTWVRVPREQVLRLPAGSDVHVRLASAATRAGTDAQPDPPRYLDRTDYGTSVAQSVRAWLRQHDIPARTWTASVTRGAETEGPTGASSIPLANGDELFIQLERTADVTFHERMVHVCRFVHAQNQLYTAEQSARSDGMILASEGMREVHRRVVEVATQGLPSLILLGPSGTGKERLAQAYHRHLGRSGVLVAINCATLSRERMVADLFGAEAGAYTDAKRAMTGAVERADGGTLFLDELGELPADVQPMLLRFLETGEYQRLGATGRPRFSDVRLVAATNRDLRRMVREGAFREDLFFRLALEMVEVPPLRDRFAEIETYLRSRTLGETSAYDALQPAAIDLLRSYPWPGNFREMMNLVRRLPSPSPPSSLDAGVLRRALQAGSLAPILPEPPRAAPEAATTSWRDWLQASADAFVQTTEREAPTSWGELSAFIEQFLKPLALAHLGGVAGAGSLDDVSIAEVADRVQADRGTVTKQLRRYFEARASQPK
jgi:DNA-binding NtrC family response regulator